MVLAKLKNVLALIAKGFARVYSNISGALESVRKAQKWVDEKEHLHVNSVQVSYLTGDRKSRSDRNLALDMLSGHHGNLVKACYESIDIASVEWQALIPKTKITYQEFVCLQSLSAKIQLKLIERNKKSIENSW